MRTAIPYTALGLALVVGAPAAHAQTVISRQVVDQPVETVITQQPVQTVRTVRTVRTTQPLARRQVVTTTRQTITRERFVPAPAVVARTVTYPQRLYDVAAPLADVGPGPQPLYDEAFPSQPPPVFGATAVDDIDYSATAAPAMGPGSTVPLYRYVYEPDRILVIDPNTNIAIQSLPR